MRNGYLDALFLTLLFATPIALGIGIACGGGSQQVITYQSVATVCAARELEVVRRGDTTLEQDEAAIAEIRKTCDAILSEVEDETDAR